MMFAGIYFGNTEMYKKKQSLVEGLEKYFKRNQGSICTKTASCCGPAESAVSRNVVTHQSNGKWKTGSVYTAFMGPV